MKQQEKENTKTEAECSCSLPLKQEKKKKSLFSFFPFITACTRKYEDGHCLDLGYSKHNCSSLESYGLKTMYYAIINNSIKEGNITGEGAAVVYPRTIIFSSAKKTELEAKVMKDTEETDGCHSGKETNLEMDKATHFDIPPM